MHKFALPAAMAAMAANEQGKFWEYHDKLFANQPKFELQQLLQYAQDVGLDVKRFQADLAAQRPKPSIDADLSEAKSLGVTGTPAFFVNGHFLNGAKPFEEFAKAVNSELQRLNLPVPPPATAQASAPPAKGK